MPRQYKVVETSTVSDDELETILNEWDCQGLGARYDPVRDARCLEAPEHGLRASSRARTESGDCSSYFLLLEGFAWRLASSSGFRR